MRDGARAAIDKRLDYFEATRAFQLTLVDEALKSSDNAVRPAASKLGVSYQFIYQIVQGKRLAKPKKQDVVERKS